MGYPRIYFGCEKEDVSSVTSEDLVKALRKGNIIITNSFFLDLKVNGARPGELVQAKDGKVHLDLKVLAPEWLAGVTTLKVFVNNKWERHIILPPSRNVLRYGKLPSDKKGIDAEIEQDSTVHVTVRGHGKMQPVVTPYYGMGSEPVVPFACTFPVFVDADGDGKYTPPSEL